MDIVIQRAPLEESHVLVSINKELNRYRENNRSRDAIRKKKHIFPKEETARVIKEQLKQPQLNRVGDVYVTQGRIFWPLCIVWPIYHLFCLHQCVSEQAGVPAFSLPIAFFHMLIC